MLGFVLTVNCSVYLYLWSNLQKLNMILSLGYFSLELFEVLILVDKIEPIVSCCVLCTMFNQLWWCTHLRICVTHRIVRWFGRYIHRYRTCPTVMDWRQIKQFLKIVMMRGKSPRSDVEMSKNLYFLRPSWNFGGHFSINFD